MSITVFSFFVVLLWFNVFVVAGTMLRQRTGFYCNIACFPMLLFHFFWKGERRVQLMVCRKQTIGALKEFWPN